LSTPRLKSRIWVEAFLRGCQSQGKFGAVLHAGHDDAGAVFVVINHLDGTHTLLGPPPGSAYDDEGNRRFETLARALAWPDVNARLHGLRQIDSDLWAVEVEDRTGLAGLISEQP
jgi:hypothetical protein